METSDIIIITQSYLGMKPKDKGCDTYGQMQEKMATEIQELFDSESKRMTKLITSTTELLDAVKKLHPRLDMGSLKEFDIYMAYHECREALENINS